jgi:hypothetical protein
MSGWCGIDFLLAWPLLACWPASERKRKAIPIHHGMPQFLVPLWQAIYRAPRRDRIWFGVAVLLYVLAKLAEVWDHELLATLGWISGHTLKHLLATAAAGVLIGRLSQRLHEPSGSSS